MHLWQYRLWSFQRRDTKLESFLAKNHHAQRKVLNFANWCSGEVSKSAKILPFYVKNHRNLSDFFSLKNTNLEVHLLELVSKELNHLATILHVYAGGLNFMK